MRGINKVLFVTMTNIGDVVLSLPALDRLRFSFPGARFTVVCGPRAAGLFCGNPRVHRCLPFDKHCLFREKLRIFNELRAEKFDLVVDLRNSLFGALLGRVRPPLAGPAPDKMKTHSSQRHLAKACFRGIDAAGFRKGGALVMSAQDEGYIDGLLAGGERPAGGRPIVISPGARSGTKRWPKERFAALAARLYSKYGRPPVLIGDAGDAGITAYIARETGSIDLAGKTTLTQLACLLGRCRVLVCNDSANLHLASYLDAPVVGIFGPSDDVRYGPWSTRSKVVRKPVACRPCQKALCPELSVRCLEMIEPQDVEKAVGELVDGADLA